MIITKAVEILKNHNIWRRDSSENINMADPIDLGIAIDKVIEYIENESGRKQLISEIKDKITNIVNNSEPDDVMFDIINLLKSLK